MAEPLHEIRVKMPRSHHQELKKLAENNTNGNMQAYMALLIGGVARGEIRLQFVQGPPKN
jgi:5-hydroxyisourate hydrolase-like protein (transthyretin family)